MIQHPALSAGVARRAAQWLYIAEMEHRVANEYARAIASLSLAAAKCSDERAKATRGAAAQGLRRYADLHSALQTPLAAGMMDLSVYLRGICEAHVKAGLGELGISLSLKETPVEIDARRCWRVGLILSELIINAARHAFAGGHGAIAIEMARSAGQVYCLISDDGRPSTGSTPGRGAHLVDALAEDIGGFVYRRFRGAGARVLLCFPELGNNTFDTFTARNR